MHDHAENNYFGETTNTLVVGTPIYTQPGWLNNNKPRNTTRNPDGLPLTTPAGPNSHESWSAEAIHVKCRSHVRFFFVLQGLAGALCISLIFDDTIRTQLTYGKKCHLEGAIWGLTSQTGRS